MNRLVALTAIILVSLWCVSGTTTGVGRPNVCSRTPPSIPSNADVYDYVIVGSGPGGATLAARLVEAGYSVLILEAGADREGSLNTTVPAFNGASTEDDTIAWNYFVDHYADTTQATKDSKYVNSNDELKRGILYPRAGTVGGCAEHNAMIAFRAYDSDWDNLAKVTGDSTWGSAHMKGIFKRFERCLHRPIPFTPGLDNHGFDGVFPTSQADLRFALKSPDLTLGAFLSGIPFQGRAGLPINLEFDPNEDSALPAGSEGLHLQVMSTNEKGQRAGARDILRRAQNKFGKYLKIQTNALASKILFSADGADADAIGVEYESGAHLFSADPNWVGVESKSPAPVRQAYARREVIISAGVFNTPQLLMLSGLGDTNELTQLGIKTRVNIPGVGKNLQDRYEVGVITKMKNKFTLLEKCSFDTSRQSELSPAHSKDACLVDWAQNGHKTAYATNGAVCGISKRSTVAANKNSDVYIFGFPAHFKGYYPGWYTTPRGDEFTWAILKSQSRNHAGRVSLRQTSARVAPKIQFNYFAEGGDQDLQAVVDGIKVARSMADSALAKEVALEEIWPGRKYASDADLKQFIRNEAWGHHACCTAKIGPDSDVNAVVDSALRVRGVRRLRVVDASVFPDIPGFFIALPTYLMSEKASEMILADAKTADADTSCKAPSASASAAAPAPKPVRPRFITKEVPGALQP